MSYNKVPNDRPIWTLFFEGTLYKQYQEYLKSHDLTKILDSRGSTIRSNSVPPVLTDETNWIPEADGKYEPSEHEAQLPPKKSNRFLTDIEKKTRSRRTTGCVVISILCLGAIAAAAALVIHFVFVTAKDAKITDSQPIKIPGREPHHNLTELLMNETLTRTVIISSPTLPSTLQSKTVTTTSAPKTTKTKTTTVSKPALVPESTLNLDPKPTTAKDTKATTGPPISPTKAPTVKTTKPVKLAEQIEMKYEVYTNATTKEIGGQLTCILHEIPNWESVYITGQKHRPELGGPVKFELKSNDEVTKVMNESRYTVEHFITPSGKKGVNGAVLELYLKVIECEDQDNYTCGVIYSGTAQNQTAEILVQALPDAKIKLDIPEDVREGESVTISASWQAGYPQPFGNITWFKRKPEDEDPTSLVEGSKSWTLRTNKEKCKTFIDSFLEITPGASFTDVEILAQATNFTDTSKVIAQESKILPMVPGN